MRQIVFCWVGLVLICCTGCSVIVTQLKDRRDDFAIRRTNRHIASRAWSDVKVCYDDLPCRPDFEKGFKRGYSDRASGLNGCPPALPPRRYWRAKLMGHEAMSRANAWFDGYRHGVVVAEQDGNADLARVPTSVPPVACCLNETYDASISSQLESSPTEYLSPPTEMAPEPQPGVTDGFEGLNPAPVQSPTGNAAPKYDEAVPEEIIPSIPPAPAPETPNENQEVPSDPNAAPPPALPPGDETPAAAGMATL